MDNAESAIASAATGLNGMAAAGAELVHRRFGGEPDNMIQAERIDRLDLG